MSKDFLLLYFLPPPPSLLGFWLSSTRTFFQSLRMCRHQRPITASNNRGRLTEGDDGHCVSFPCCLYPELLSLGFCAVLDVPVLSPRVMFFFPPLPGRTSCLCHATNLHPPRLCGTVLHVTPSRAALLQCTALRQAGMLHPVRRRLLFILLMTIQILYQSFPRCYLCFC